MIKEALKEHYEGKYFHMQEAVPRKYGKIHFDISSFEGLQDIQGKPYQSRAEVPVTFEGIDRDDLELVIIGFGPNQGTGNFDDFEDLVDYMGNPISSQQTPRLKKGIIGEVMLPLVDLNENYFEQIGTNSLDYITLASRVSDCNPIIQGNKEYIGEVSIEENFGKHDGTFEGQFDVQVPNTYYSNHMGEFGNPHALYNPKSCDQIAGFIPFPKEKEK